MDIFCNGHYNQIRLLIFFIHTSYYTYGASPTRDGIAVVRLDRCNAEVFESYNNDEVIYGN